MVRTYKARVWGPNRELCEGPGPFLTSQLCGEQRTG